MINDWWSGDRAERFWMETTGRADLGADLHAPQFNGAGKPEWGYTLVAETRPGDVILHWHKSLIGRPALVGWSLVTGPLSVDENYTWMPQGTRGRARGVPTVGSGWRMPCSDFHALARPVDRATLADREMQIKLVHDDLKRRVGSSIYFPFIFYRPGEIRSTQSYLTKFPARLLKLFPELNEVQRASARSADASSARPARASGGRGGRLQETRRRLAVEQHAVRQATQYYLKLGASEVEELGKPFDLLVRGLGPVRHVEVKGSTTAALDVVELTVNEVAHAQNHQPTDLVVVDHIALHEDATGELSAAGGRLRIWRDWVPEAAALSPTRYVYGPLAPHHEELRDGG